MLVCSSADKKPIEQDKSSDTLRTGAHNDAERQRSLTMASRTSDVTLADMESLSIISSAPTLVGSTSFSQLKEEAALQNSSDPESSENTVQIDPRSSENNDQILSITRSSSSEHSAQMNPQEAFVVRQACRYNCYCKCHEQDTTKDRRRFHRLRTQKMTCTDANCLNIIEETFEVHSKLFSRALSQVMSSKSIKVRYNLNTYRMVPEGSDALRYIKHGRLEKLQACIESGEATIYDTAPDGWSLLHVGQV